MADFFGPVQIKGGTSTAWGSSNPVLLEREPGIDLTLMRVKVGDGVRPWSALPWVTMDPADVAKVLESADAIEGAVGADDALMTMVANDPNSAFRDVLSATITSQVEGLVPGEVSDALTNDPLVIGAVNDAITDADIPGEVAIALAAQAGKIVQGTGMPNGAVTADPGTLYVDTAATNGASVWRKATGTGASGWVVVDGDTGWRDVSGLLINGWSPHAHIPRIRRTAETAEFRGYLNGSARTSIEFLPVPAGFGLNVGSLYPMGIARSPSSGTWFSPVTVASAGFRIHDMTAMSDAVFIHVHWQVSDAWPNTLPGTPA